MEMSTLEQIKAYLANGGVLWHMTTKYGSKKIMDSGMVLRTKYGRVYFYLDPSRTPSDYDLCRHHVNEDGYPVYDQDLDLWCAQVTPEMLDNMHLDMALNEFTPGAAVYVEGIAVKATLHTASARKAGVCCVEYRK